jgi:hypothetical protein
LNFITQFPVKSFFAPDPLVGELLVGDLLVGDLLVGSLASRPAVAGSVFATRC